MENENKNLLIDTKNISFDALNHVPKISRRVYDPIYGQIGFDQNMYINLIIIDGV